MARPLTEQALTSRHPTGLRTAPGFTGSPALEAPTTSLRTAADDLITAGGPRPTGTAAGSEFVEILGMDAQFDVAPSVCATPSGVCWNVAIADWDNLLSAVKENEEVEPVNKGPSRRPRETSPSRTGKL